MRACLAKDDLEQLGLDVGTSDTRLSFGNPVY